MARRGGRRGRRAAPTNGLPGMPSQAQIQAQALQLARASVPTMGSINRQFRRSETDMQGFTKALVSILRGDANRVSSGYSGAIKQQEALDTQAAKSLGAKVGPEYDAAADTALARGSTAVGSLIAKQAGQGALAQRQPGFAAGRGWLARMGLEQQRQDALANRSDALRQSFTQAYQQVQSNAFNQAMGLAQLGLSERQLRESRREFNLNLTTTRNEQDRQYNLDVSRLNEGAREFDAEQKRLWAAQMADLAGGSKKGLAAKLGVTPTQLSTMIRTGAKYLYPQPKKVYNPKTKQWKDKKQANPVESGVKFTDAVNTLVHQYGLPHRLALVQAIALYKSYSGIAHANGPYTSDIAYTSYLDWANRNLQLYRGGAASAAGRPD